MGIDCSFIAKVKDKDEYEKTFLSRLYYFVEDFEESIPRYPVWSGNFDSMVAWLREHLDGNPAVEALYNFIVERRDNWEKATLIDDCNDDYFDVAENNKIVYEAD